MTSRKDTRPSARPHPKGLSLGIAFALAAGTLAVYAPARSLDFVGIDDPLYVSENARVAAGLTVGGARWAFATWHGGYWIPLTWVSYMLDVELWGPGAAGHHVTNVLLHAANSVLLFVLLGRLTRAPWRSAFVAALFALHPLHVESVAWITERKDVLSTAFMLLAIWAYVAYVRRPRRAGYALVGALFGLSLMAKPMTVTLPFVLLLLDVWPLCRWAPGGGGTGGPRAKRPSSWSALRPLVWEKVPLLALSLGASVVAYLAQRHAGAVGGLEGFPLGLRIQNAVVSYAVYLLRTIWPAGLAAVYPFPDSIPVWQVAAAAALLAALSILFLRRAVGHLPLAVGWLWYLGTLVPVIGVVQVGIQGMADRFTYVPLIGVFIVAAWAVPERLTAGRSTWRLATGAAGACLVAACLVATRAQIAYWKDNVALWTRVIQVTQGMSALDAHLTLGATLRDQDRLDEAARHFAEALEIDPRSAVAWAGSGLVLERQGRDAEAMTAYESALALDAALPEVHNNLGVLLARQGRLAEATEHFAAAARLEPGFELALVNLGLGLMRTGRGDEAAAALTEALRLNPGNQVARDALASLRRGPGAR